MQTAPVTLDLEHADIILDALATGLAAYGEIERLSDVFERHQRIESEQPSELRPIHPTGASDTVSDFATAIALLHGAMRRAR